MELVENLGDGVVYLTHFARRNAESGCGSSYNKQTDLHIYIKRRSVVKSSLKRNLPAFSPKHLRVINKIILTRSCLQLSTTLSSIHFHG